MASKKVKITELAKELGMTNKEMLELSTSMGIDVKSTSSSIEDAQADRVRRKAERDGLKRDKQPDEEKLHQTGAVLDGSDDRLLDWIDSSGIAALIADNQAVEGYSADLQDRKSTRLNSSH